MCMEQGPHNREDLRKCQLNVLKKYNDRQQVQGIDPRIVKLNLFHVDPSRIFHGYAKT